MLIQRYEGKCFLFHHLRNLVIHCAALPQNADDNVYGEGVVPKIEFVLVEADVVGVGVEWTLFVLNNEIGFSRANVESLCSIGRSTKKGKRDSHGYIGEKGMCI
jgi:sacsin